MNVLQGAFTVVDLGKPTARYFFNGQELQGVIKVFVYKGTSVTLTVSNKEVLPVAELKAYGIKVKEQR